MSRSKTEQQWPVVGAAEASRELASHDLSVTRPEQCGDGADCCRRFRFNAVFLFLLLLPRGCLGPVFFFSNGVNKPASVPAAGRDPVWAAGFLAGRLRRGCVRPTSALPCAWRSRPLVGGCVALTDLRPEEAAYDPFGGVRCETGKELSLWRRSLATQTLYKCHSGWLSLKAPRNSF